MILSGSAPEQVFDLPVRRMISLVPSALERMIAARQACLCEALRSLKRFPTDLNVGFPKGYR
jgi:hypothetical protein